MSEFSELSFVNVLKLFIDEICLLNDSKLLKNYQLLLSKINETKKLALEVQCQTFKEFLDSNRNEMLTKPLALQNYTINWYPMQKSPTKASFTLDLLPSFAKASQNQQQYMHHLLATAASMIYDEEEYSKLAAELKTEPVDMERTIVKQMFQKIREFDKSGVQLNELDDPGKFEKTIESIMASKLPELMMSLKRPGIRWKFLWKYFVEEIEIINEEYDIKDTEFNEFIKSLKNSDYEITSIAPKIFAFIKTANLGKFLNFNSELSSLSDDMSTLALDPITSALNTQVVDHSGTDTVDSHTVDNCKDGICSIPWKK